MKTSAVAVIAALLLASLVLTPAAAASSSSQPASVNCGDTYVVQPLDYLVRIANYCGTTVANILALNPQIANPSIIYSGQVLRLTTNVPIPSWPTYSLPLITSSTSTTYNGNARVTVSTTQAYPGGSVTVYASGFPANANIDFRVGLQGGTFSLAYDSLTASDGTASQTVTIPSGALVGQYWVVQVITTSLANVVSVNSAPIYITSYTYTQYPTYTSSPYTTYSGSARVTVSTTQAYPGGSVTVYASGFPANVPIDYRVGLQGAAFSLVYDGTTASDGTDNQTVIIPSGAVAGQYWTVQVVTTSLKDIVSVYSAPIYIPGYSYYTNYTQSPSVSLSTTQTTAGGKVSVYVTGFPANAQIDYRVGLQGEPFSLVYDGKIDAYGSDNQTITIPSGATAGQYWTVLVITTSLKDITQVTSHTIYITN